MRDGFIEVTSYSLTRRKLDARGQLGSGLLLSRIESAGKESDLTLVVLRGGGQYQILQRTTQAEIHFPPVRIERAQVPPQISVHFNLGRAHPKQPGLAVESIRTKNGRMHQSQWSFLGVPCEVPPRLECRSFPEFWGVLTESAPHFAIGDQDRHRGCAAQKQSAFHDLFLSANRGTSQRDPPRKSH